MFIYKYKSQPLRHFPSENEHYIVYKHTNKINGKCYVGQTCKTMEERWRDHVGDSKKKNPSYSFQRAIKKYGEEAWTHEILEVLQTELFCNASEIYWIDFYRSTSPTFGYNLTHGGDTNRPNAETRKKMSVTSKIAMNRPEVRQRNSETHKGKKLSEEHKQKISESGKIAMNRPETKQRHREATNRPETKHKRSKAHKGKKDSEETRRRKSESAKIAQNRPEVRQRNSETHKGKIPWNKGKPSPNKGKKMSPESIQKQRETRRRNREAKHLTSIES